MLKFALANGRETRKLYINMEKDIQLGDGIILRS